LGDSGVISDYLQYFIGDVVYRVMQMRNNSSNDIKLIIFKETINKIVITGHSKYDYFVRDENISNFKVFDTFAEAKEHCKVIAKNRYDSLIQLIDGMKDDDR
jgi:hypothetical protein